MPQGFAPIPRGLRNCNPGNIRAVGRAPWKGQTGSDADGFVIFGECYDGLRALALLLRNYVFEHNRTTIRTIISRYAPTTENDTDAYVAWCSKIVGIDSDAVIHMPVDAGPLMWSIIAHENGKSLWAPIALQDVYDQLFASQSNQVKDA